jgi:hypothetical protein
MGEKGPRQSTRLLAMPFSGPPTPAVPTQPEKYSAKKLDLEIVRGLLAQASLKDVTVITH